MKFEQHQLAPEETKRAVQTESLWRNGTCSKSIENLYLDFLEFKERMEVAEGESIGAAVGKVLMSKNCEVSDYYLMYGTRIVGDETILPPSIHGGTLSLRPRIRGGRDQLLVRKHLPLRLKHGNPNYDEFITELSPIGRRSVRLLFELLERMHVAGKCLDGDFTLDDIVYIESFNRLSFKAGVKLVNFYPGGYMKDMISIALILQEYFCYTHPDGSRRFPIYMQSLIDFIVSGMDNWGWELRKRRSFIFNHCCFMTSTERAMLICSLREFIKGLDEYSLVELKYAFVDTDVWTTDMKATNQTLKVLNYTRRNPNTGRVEVVKNYLERCPLSKLDYVRCFIIHTIKGGKVTMEEAENFFAILDSKFLPEMLLGLLHEYNQTEAAKEKMDIDNILGWRTMFEHRIVDEDEDYYAARIVQVPLL
uniref:Uncharacterized protein n=1 Tax=Leersia perrieri TaxID=77586 RepID=A0A0D9XG08_9ORYZ